MKLLLDCNVLLDVLLDRKPHVEASAAVWSAVERGKAEGLVAAHSVTTIHYLLRRAEGNAKSKRIVRMILGVVGVAAVDERVLTMALQSGAADFEDAVSEAAARLNGCDVIVTRDPKGFRGSELAVMTPEMVLPLLSRV